LNSVFLENGKLRNHISTGETSMKINQVQLEQIRKYTEKTGIRLRESCMKPWSVTSRL
jgi:hypothetical protein